MLDIVLLIYVVIWFLNLIVILCDLWEEKKDILYVLKEFIETIKSRSILGNVFYWLVSPIIFLIVVLEYCFDIFKKFFNYVDSIL